MNIIKKNTFEYELNQGILSVTKEKESFTLQFVRNNELWSKENITQYFANKFYFIFYDKDGCLFYFLPSILMKEELIGLSFLDKYYLKKNTYKKDEMILSTFLCGEENAYIKRQYTYSIIHNDEFLILGMDGYRKIIARNNQRIENEMIISQKNLYETEIISPKMLLSKPINKDLHLVHSSEIIGENLFKFPDV